MLLAACESAAPASPAGPGLPTPAVKVAFVRDLSMPDAEEHALPASRGGFGKAGGGDGLAGAGRAGQKNAAASKKASSAKHRIEPRDAGRNPLVRHLVVQAQRGDGQDAEAVVADQERKLVGAVQRAADEKSPGGKIFGTDIPVALPSLRRRDINMSPRPNLI
jgi:hypothetical protein